MSKWLVKYENTSSSHILTFRVFPILLAGIQHHAAVWQRSCLCFSSIPWSTGQMTPRTPTMTALSCPRWGYKRRDSANWDYSSVRFDISSLNQDDSKSGELHYLGLNLLIKSTVPVLWYSEGKTIALWNSATELLTYLYTNGILHYTPRHIDEYHGIIIIWQKYTLILLAMTYRN